MCLNLSLGLALFLFGVAVMGLTERLSSSSGAVVPPVAAAVLQAHSAVSASRAEVLDAFRRRDTADRENRDTTLDDNIIARAGVAAMRQASAAVRHAARGVVEPGDFLTAARDVNRPRLLEPAADTSVDAVTSEDVSQCFSFALSLVKVALQANIAPAVPLDRDVKVALASIGSSVCDVTCFLSTVQATRPGRDTRRLLIANHPVTSALFDVQSTLSDVVRRQPAAALGEDALITRAQEAVATAQDAIDGYAPEAPH